MQLQFECVYYIPPRPRGSRVGTRTQIETFIHLLKTCRQALKTPIQTTARRMTRGKPWLAPTTTFLSHSLVTHAIDKAFPQQTFILVPVSGSIPSLMIVSTFEIPCARVSFSKIQVPLSPDTGTTRHGTRSSVECLDQKSCFLRRFRVLCVREQNSSWYTAGSTDCWPPFKRARELYAPCGSVYSLSCTTNSSER